MTTRDLLAWGVLAAAWVGAMNVVSLFTWGYGRRTFWLLCALCTLLLLARPLVARIRAGLPDAFARLPRSLLLTAGALLLLALVGRLALGFAHELEQERNRGWAVDIALNTKAAEAAFLHGENPYTVRTQLGHRVERAPGVTHGPDGLRMFGVAYAYGYPYYPAMFLSYLPFRLIDPGLHSIRWANGVLLATNLVGLAWLLRSWVVPAAWPAATGLTAILYLGIAPLSDELFRLGVTDLVIATYALYGYVALSRGRPALCGLLLGLAQACKLLPGPFLLLPALLFLGRAGGRRRLLGAWALTAGLLVLPFALADPARFLSATLLYYLTHHAAGDSTSLWFFLPTTLKLPFQLLGIVAAGGLVLLAGRSPERDPVWPAALAFAGYVIFAAFNRMTHLNYLWGVYTLGCAALVGQLAAATGLAPAGARPTRPTGAEPGPAPGSGPRSPTSGPRSRWDLP